MKVFSKIIIAVLVLLLFWPGSIVQAQDDEVIASLMEDIQMAKELTELLMEVQSLLLDQLQVMQAELEYIRAVQGSSSGTSSVVPEKVTKRRMSVSSLQSVTGVFNVVDSGVWKSDMGIPSAAYFPEKFSGPVAIQADVSFAGGYRTIGLGLYDPAEDIMILGGTDYHRSSFVVGAGTNSSPGMEWELFARDDRVTRSDAPYHLRVEIHPQSSQMLVRVFVDGSLVHQGSGPVEMRGGYPVIRTWGSRMQVENFVVEEL